MSVPMPHQDTAEKITLRLCRIGSASAFILVIYCLATMVQMLVLGTQPANAAEAFDLLQTNRIVGLLRLDFPTVLAMPLYYLLFPGLLAALWRADALKAILSVAFVFVGVTLALATPMALSMVPLSEKYAAATNDATRNQFLAAGEAVLAMDMWHGTGAFVGGALAQTGAVLICLAMLKSASFSRLTGWLGLLMHGLDLVHIVLGLFLPAISTALMVIAGPLYPIWFFLVGRTLRQIARTGPGDALPNLGNS